MALNIQWTDEARADIRALDRTTAMQVFDGLYHYAVTGVGDVKALQGQHAGKAAVADWRLPHLLQLRQQGLARPGGQKARWSLSLSQVFTFCYSANGNPDGE